MRVVARCASVLRANESSFEPHERDDAADPLRLFNQPPGFLDVPGIELKVRFVDERVSLFEKHPHLSGDVHGVELHGSKMMARRSGGKAKSIGFASLQTTAILA